MFKVIIAGGRDFRCYTFLKEMCDKVLKDKTDIEIVSGGAKGADLHGEIYAHDRKYKLKIFKADWDKHGKAAGPIRNTEMAEYADALIAFWDGKSRGTQHMIETARRLGLSVRVFEYKLQKTEVMFLSEKYTFANHKPEIELFVQDKKSGFYNRFSDKYITKNK